MGLFLIIRPLTGNQTGVHDQHSTLAEAVRADKKIKGITLPDGFVSKWVGYSDDGNATLSDFDSVKQLFKMFYINAYLEPKSIF